MKAVPMYSTPIFLWSVVVSQRTSAFGPGSLTSGRTSVTAIGLQSRRSRSFHHERSGHRGGVDVTPEEELTRLRDGLHLIGLGGHTLEDLSGEKLLLGALVRVDGHVVGHALVV